MTSYKTDRARAAAYAADSAVYARRRFVSGLFLGLLIHVLAALVLGFFLINSIDTSLAARLGATALSCFIATPVTCVLGFAIGLSGRLRRLGMGIVVGALLGTVLIAALFWLVG